MIHTFQKEYKLSKSQINEIYPEEAPIYLQFIGFEYQHNEIQQKLDYLKGRLDDLEIHHADPVKVQNQIISNIEQVQGVQVRLNMNKEADSDDELPDKEALERLKRFKEKYTARRGDNAK